MNKAELMRECGVLGGETLDCVETLFTYAYYSKKILELGVMGGNSTRVMLLACKYGGGHLWSMDKCIPSIETIVDATRVQIKGLGLDKYWTFICTDSMKYIPEWKEKVDMIFIDSDHGFKVTLQELEGYTPYLEKNGVVFLHDTLPHATRLVASINVIGAIRCFLKLHPEWEYKEECPTGCGLGKMWRREFGETKH